MKKQNAPTLAQKLFKDKSLITKRPDDMTYAEYRLIRKAQTTALRMLIRHKPNRRIERLMPIRLGYNRHF